VDRRFEELEQHADGLETHVGRLVALASGTLIYFGLEQWMGRSVLGLSFVGALVFTTLAMGAHKTPILWRHVRYLPHLRNRRDERRSKASKFRQMGG
jgi:hypothetical protein